LTYKSALSARLQLCSQYTEEGFTPYDEPYKDWDQLTGRLNELPRSQIAVIAFMDQYGRDIGKFEVHHICSDELDQFVREKKGFINLKWSRVMYKPLEA
jgi:hypothetical protein